MKRPFPLAYKVVLAFLSVLLPLLFIFLLSLHTIYRNTGAMVGENLRAASEARAGELLFFLETLRLRVIDVSTDGVIREGFEEAIDEGVPEAQALGAYMAENKLPVLGEASRLSLLRMDGVVIASTDRDVVGDDQADEAFFRRGLEGPSVTVRPEGPRGLPELAVSAPLYSMVDGELLGVLASSVPHKRLVEILERGRGAEIGVSRLALEGYATLDAYLVDSEKVMITPSWLIGGPASMTVADTEAVRACLDEGRDHLGAYEDYRGVPVVGSSVCMPDFGWVLLVEVDKKEAFAPVRRLVNYGILTGVVVLLLLSAFAAYFFRVARQLRTIASASKEIADGNYGARVPLRSEDEIGALAGSFNRMAGEVEERSRALSESEEKYRGLVEAINDWVWEVDEDLVYTYVSPRVRSILGYEPEEIIGKTPWVLMPPEEAERVKKDVAEAMGKREPFNAYENTNIRRDGSIVVLETNASPIFDSKGAFRGYRGIDRDITERKAAENALRVSESRLANAQRLASLGNWDWDIVTNELHWSDEIYRIFGVAPREFGATYDAFLGYVHPEDRDKVITAVDGALYDKKYYSIDHRVVLRDGTEKIVHEEAEVVYDDGRPLRMSGTVQDITERKKAEDEIRKLNVELEERVAERTAELEAANSELEAFSYSVAHDLKTPLRTIDGFARILMRDSAEALGPSGREYIERLVAASRRMGELIDALLKLSRVMRAEISVERVYLSGVARAVASDLKKAQPEREAEVVIQENLAVDGDPGLLKTVMENLLGNAWKFTSKKKAARIEFGSYGEKDGKTVFFVSDNGAGFEMKYAERLFDPFQRLHGEDEFPGTGVGLATVQRIIRRHGGSIWAEGERDRGATFYFTI